MTIPWITRWTGETDPSTYVALKERAFNGAPIERQVEPTNRTGKPEFAKVHSDRAWRCATENLCQVCGMPEADYYREIGHMIENGLYLHTEAGTCLACTAVAERECPDVGKHALNWWKCITIGVGGGLFGPLGVPEDVAVTLVAEGAKPPAGTVLKAPLILIRALHPMEEA